MLSDSCCGWHCDKYAYVQLEKQWIGSDKHAMCVCGSSGWFLKVAVFAMAALVLVAAVVMIAFDLVIAFVVVIAVAVVILGVVVIADALVLVVVSL